MHKKAIIKIEMFEILIGKNPIGQMQQNLVAMLVNFN